jgi:hypothetical protein
MMATMAPMSPLGISVSPDLERFQASMPSDLIRGWTPVRVKKTRKKRIQSPVLMQSEPKGSR